MTETRSSRQRIVTRLSASDCPISYGMVHLRASPGAPRSSHSVAQIVAIALQEAQAYIKGGLNGLLIENMHDLPYMNRQAGPEVVASMACAAWELRKAFPSVPIGLQVLAGCNRESMAIAHACDCDFIRAESFVFGHVGDEGYMDACAGDLLRYRRAIGACDVRVFTDVKKKHSAHAVTADVSIAETAVAAAFFDVDGVIVTGSSTGHAACISEVGQVANAMLPFRKPVLIGSGVDSNNVDQYLAADALIVGSSLKVDGCWQNDVCPLRVAEFVSALHEAAKRLEREIPRSRL